MEATRISGENLFVVLSAVGVFGGMPDPDVRISPDLACAVLDPYFRDVDPQDVEEVYFLSKDCLRDVLAQSERLRKSWWGIAAVVEQYLAPFADDQRKTCGAFIRLLQDAAIGKIPIEQLH